MLFLDVLVAEVETGGELQSFEGMLERKPGGQGLIYRGQGTGGSICSERGIGNCKYVYTL